MRQNAICFRCGTFKSDFQARCPSCTFTPVEDIDIAKSRVLGPLYSFAVGENGATVDTGRSHAELKEIALEIRQGRPYEFPKAELAGVLQVYLSVKSTTRRQFWQTMLPLYLGLIVVLGGMSYVIWAWPR